MSTEYRLTIMDSIGLSRRLIREVTFAVDRMKSLWPELKRDPIGVTKQVGRESGQALRRFFSAPNRLAATCSAFVIVSVAVIALFVSGAGRKASIAADDDSLALTKMLNFENDTSQEKGLGVGMNSKGRVGFNRGTGEGSNPTPSKSGGGGGGGNHDLTAAQKGRLPEPSAIPAPIPKVALNQSPTLPAAGIDIDPALWKAMPDRNYGDPRSNATIPSNGPGDGGGMGNSNGLGVGNGNGNGVGPGDKRNLGGGPDSDGSRGSGGSNDSRPGGSEVLANSKTTTRARVVSKPEPRYTEEARRNQVSGTVVLRVVFASSGQVTDIRTVSSLPYGLTEKAIAAARQIRFSPAQVNGRPVSVYFQLEYNFNLY